jgi:hypothetical protein
MNPDISPTACLDHLVTLARWAADLSVDGLGAQSDEILLAALSSTEEFARLIGAIQANAAAIVEERSTGGSVSEGLAAKYGHSRATHLIEQITRISQSEANQRIWLGKSIRGSFSITGEPIAPQHPVVAEALNRGAISGAVARRITSGLAQARKFHIAGENEEPGEFEENIAVAEEALVEEAAHESEDAVQVQVNVWRDALDPDGAPMRDEDVRARRGLRRGRERNGVTKWEWYTVGETTAILEAMLADARAATKPRFVPTEDINPMNDVGVSLADEDETAAMLSGDFLAAPSDGALDGSGDSVVDGVDCTQYGVVIHIEDTRTSVQRDSDVLDGFLRAGIRASTNEMGSLKPIVEVTAVATLADLEAGRGVGFIQGLEEPVSIEYIKELACGTGYRLVIQGDEGEVLWMGPKPRFFDDNQKKAVVVRDGPTCVTEGCVKPARQCHVHHVEFHSEGGPTDVDNAVLLCSEHHHMIHKSPFKIEMHNGTPWILGPRWLNPKQTWKPMGHPRHRVRRFKE